MPNVRHVSKQLPCEPRQRQPFNLSDFDAKKDKAGLSAARTSCMKETPKRAKIRAHQAREQAQTG
jgi:hypothetical protein